MSEKLARQFNGGKCKVVRGGEIVGTMGFMRVFIKLKMYNIKIKRYLFIYLFI